jgi:RNA polymerase sigma-70 factor (ECF subfamily)
MPNDLDQSVSLLSDNEIIERILGGNAGLYQVIVKRYNRRLYRVVWAIVKDDQEAEDVMQEAYVRAYEHLTQFAGRSRFSTWLTRIAVHESLSRIKYRNRQCDIDAITAPLRKATAVVHTPENDVLAMEARTLLEQAISELPEAERTVFVMRSLEEISTAETAKCLDITEDAVKMRIMRARCMLRQILYNRARAKGSRAFQFLGERCNRLTRTVLLRISVES